MSLGISFESASHAAAYAYDVLGRARLQGLAFVPRDTGPLRRRIQRRMAASLPDIGPSPLLASYARKMERNGLTHWEISSRWGCAPETVGSALALYPEEQPEQQAEQESLFSSPCEPLSGSL